MDVVVGPLVVEWLIGLFTGVVSGLLGVGGGPIMIAGMVLILGVGQKVAQGVSLAVIVPTAIAGAITHYRGGNVVPRVALWLVPTAVVGAIVGANLAALLDAALLRRLFGLLLLLLSARMMLSR